MFRWIGRWIDRIFAVLGAILLSQAPLYIHQYTQQLTGHAIELSWQYQAMQQAAQKSDKSLPAYIDKFTSSSDADVARQGAIMNETIERYNHFEEALTQLSQATPLSRPFIFVRYVNMEVAKSTFAIFEPGFPFTVEGLAYALIGMILGYGVFYGIGKILASIFYFFRRKPRQTPS